MRKRRFLLSLALLAAAALNLGAQRKSDDALRAELQADPAKYGGVYYMDSFAERDLTAAPKGYKPFYISTYARHGARYILYEKQYTKIEKTFKDAAKAGNLTPFGERIFARFDEAYTHMKGRGGELSSYGKAQHKGLGERMIRNYPEVFKGNSVVHAFSTDVPRTIQSMTFFLEGLREANSKLFIYPEVSRADKHFLNPHSSDHFKVDRWFWDCVRAKDAPWRLGMKDWLREKMDPEACVGRLFKDPGKLPYTPDDIVWELFYLACDMQCIPVEAEFWDIFTEDEKFALWELDNYLYYAEKGPDPLNFKHGYEVSGYMLKDILDRAENDIASGEVQADLRFGHDGCLMGLLTVMNVGDWQKIVPRDEVKNYWQVHNIPMAANLQLIFYRNKKGDILLKALLNEKNLALPLEAVEEPYYRWTDFLDYYRPRAEAAIADVESGAPQNLSGTVYCDGRPVEGVKVSDGIQIVKTDADGHYSMFTDKRAGFVFVISPSGAVPAVQDGPYARFYEPLSEDPYSYETHDFYLRSEDQQNYSVALLTDMHLTDDPCRGDLDIFRGEFMPFLKENVAALKAEGPVYALNLGDLTHDLFWGLYGFNPDKSRAFLKEEGFPATLYSIPGNHDNNPSITGENVDRRAEAPYRAAFGPTWYAMEIGSECWIMMDNIIYENNAGKGKKAPGVAGDRKYSKGFTPDEMAFLKAYLKLLPDDANVFICTHCPIIKEGSTYMSPDQAKQLDKLFARFGKVEALSGHVHRMAFPKWDEAPHISQTWVPATSGNMWTTRPNPMIGSDGEDAGAFFLRFSSGSEPVFDFRSCRYGEKWMRIYDMNQVRSAYAGDAEVMEEIRNENGDGDYSDPKYKNWIYVNYWGWKHGQSVEILENGKPLQVEKTDDPDPIFRASFAARWKDVEPAELFVTHKVHSSNHMFRAKAKKAKGKVSVIVKDASGEVVHEETITRPKAFSFAE